MRILLLKIYAYTAVNNRCRFHRIRLKGVKTGQRGVWGIIIGVCVCGRQSRGYKIVCEMVSGEYAAHRLFD